MTTENVDRRYVIDNSRVAWSRSDDQFILLDLATSTYLATNASAQVLWEQLVEGASLSQLTESICACFGVPADQARGEVFAFVTDLERRGMVSAETG